MEFSAKVHVLKNPSGSMRAFATLVVDGVLQINGFRVLDGQYGMFVSAPSKKASKPDENGKYVYYDDVRFDEPIEETEDGKKKRGPVALAAYAAILEAYQKATNATGGDQRPQASGTRPNLPRHTANRDDIPW